jgi:hypothetical protein
VAGGVNMGAVGGGGCQVGIMRLSQSQEEEGGVGFNAAHVCFSSPREHCVTDA